MGSSVIARCECGFGSGSLIGGGMLNYLTTCYFPCLCERCHDIVQVNLIPKKLVGFIPIKIRCPVCRSTKIIPYNSPELSDSTGDIDVASWPPIKRNRGRLVLTDGDYKCPKCKKMTLKFTCGGLLWD
jgi:hypothetical protein